MKRIIVSVIGVLFFFVSYGQTYITTKKEFGGKVGYEFSPDWQYLTMEMILLNDDKFSNLLNDLDKPGKGLFGKLKNDDDLIESVDLRVVLKNLKYFNKAEIEFPFFRLKVDFKKNSNEYSCTTVQQADVHTILEDFPLGSVPSQVIDLHYKATAVTKEKQSQSLTFISKQLKNIASLTAPDKFVLSLVGQFGDFLTAETEGRQVHWGSTLRAFENRNKHQKIHSINVYTMRPSDANLDKGGRFNANKLNDYLQKLTGKENSKLTKIELQQLTDFNKYPVLIVVNYLTKYIPEDVPENISHDEIIAMQDQIRRDYEEGNDVKEVNKQREIFTYFLKYMADLRLALDPFTEKYEGKFDYNQEHATFQVMVAYKKLLMAYERILEQNKALPEFKGFYPRYEQVKTRATDELNLYPPLKNVAQVATLNLELEKRKWEDLESKELELYISLLKGVELPDKFRSYDEFKSLERQISVLEDLLYEKKYKEKREFFLQCTLEEENYAKYIATNDQLKKTNCKLCTDQVKDGLAVFKQKWDQKTYKEAVALAKQQQKHSVDFLATYLADTSAIVSNRKELIKKNPNLEIKFNHLKENLFKEIRDLVVLSQRAELEKLTETELLNYSYKVDRLMKSVEMEITSLYKDYPEFLAGCMHHGHKQIMEEMVEVEMPKVNLTEGAGE